MNKKCLGCGIPLQDKDINLDGYISNIDKNICTRCFKIKNYGVYNKANMSNKDYMKIIDSITNNDLVIYVSSLLNLNIDYINKFKDVILVLTKRDILPKSVKDNKIIDYIKKRYNNIKDIIIISSIKNYNMDHLYNTILKYGIDKKADTIYAEFDVISPDEELEEVDAIVVTSITFFDEIEELLSKKVDCPIISLEDILYEV